PKIAELQKKYKNDQDKLNKKTMELYKKENVSMFSGCLPLLITMPILFAMFAALRMISNEQIANQAFHLIATGTAPKFESWLWIKNIWMPDSPFNSVMLNSNSLRMIPADIWQRAYDGLDAGIMEAIKNTGILIDFTAGNHTATAEAMFTYMQSLPVYQAEMQLVPGFQNFLFGLSLYKNFNGLFLLPVLSGASQILMTKMTQVTPTGGDATQPQAGGAFMKWFFPIFSVYICATSNAGFSIYWVTANVIATVQNFILNKYLDAKDKREEELIVQKGSVVK
ncbi:MAG: YidC/Oxa1 family membrane protein insertase, partial [Clostridiales bacterium]|nr:YidC/Oxa1 family membrane protein insertase [Clostridiales bacterium]